jgi:hypothetical protein
MGIRWHQVWPRNKHSPSTWDAQGMINTFSLIRKKSQNQALAQIQ